MRIPRALTPVEVQHAIGALRALVARYGSAAATAHRLRMQDSGEAAVVALALGNGHLEAPLAEAIALCAGLPFEDMLSGRAAVLDGTLRLGDLLGWQDATQAAAHEGVPPWLIDVLRRSFVPFTMTPASPKMVVDVAKHWARHGRRELENLSALKVAPRYETLSGWDRAATAVLRGQLLPTYVVTFIGDALVPFPLRHVEPEMLVDAGGLWMTYAPLAVRCAAERADILAERARRLAEEEARYARLDEGGATELVESRRFPVGEAGIERS
jgi:hypothetical protein